MASIEHFSLPDISIDALLVQNPKHSVFKGIRKSTSTAIVIKVPEDGISHADAKLKFEEELQHTKTFLNNLIGSSEEIVALDNGTPALVRKYIVGEPLNEAVKVPVRNLRDFFGVAIPLLEILLEVHKKGLVHRDLKPQNIIYRKNPEGKAEIGLIDFQISCRINTISENNVAIGTFQYMAPEQTGRISRSIDFRTDLYSIGVIFYELLIGKLPFEAKDPLGYIHAHVASIPERLDRVCIDIPAAIAEVVQKLLAKNSDSRYQSTEGLLTDIRKLEQYVVAGIPIQNFVCGEFDHSIAPVIPQKLYGREQALQTLVNAFIKTISGKGGVVLVTGNSGCGKTSLVRELCTQVAVENGYYIEGKCDLVARDVPYAVFWELFKGIIKQILVEPEQMIIKWKQRIKSYISTNAALLIDVVPELKFLLDEISPLAELSPVESKQRFETTIKQFLKCISTGTNPVCAFIDDLQWIDNASLTLLSSFAEECNSLPFLIIGCYRDNEVSITHPLAQAVQAWQEKNIPIEFVLVKPLETQTIALLLSETLLRPVEDTFPIAEFLFKRSEGNAFFVIQLLHNLIDNSIFTYDLKTASWQWEFEKIERVEVPSTMLGFLEERIKKLSKSQHEILGIAALIGDIFENGLLVGVITELERRYKWHFSFLDECATKDGSGTIARDLDFLVMQGFFVQFNADKENVMYKFVHDKIRQAVLDLLQNKEREQAISHAISVVLQKRYGAEEITQHVFEILRHANASQDLQVTLEEKRGLAFLNFCAAKRARLSNAFAAAIEYARFSVHLLGEAGWNEHFEQVFETHLLLAQCYGLQNHKEEAFRSLEICKSHARNKDQRILVLFELSRLCSLFAMHQESMAYVRSVFSEVNIKTPAHPNLLHVALLYLNLMIRILFVKNKKLENLPICTNPEMKRILDWSAEIFGSSYVLNVVYSYYYSTLLLILTIKFGLTDSSPSIITTGSGVVIAGFHRYKYGETLAQTAIKLADASSKEIIKARTYMLLSSVVLHYYRPFSELIERLQIGINIAFKQGDKTNTQLFQRALISYVSLHGNNLGSFFHQLEVGREFYGKNTDRVTHSHFDLLESIAKGQEGTKPVPWELTSPEFKSEEDFLEHLRTSDRIVYSVFFWIKVKLLVTWGKAGSGALWYKKMWKTRKEMIGFIDRAEILWLSGVMENELIDSHEKGHSFFTLVRFTMMVWEANLLASMESEVYVPRATLTSAERARYMGNVDKAMFLYEITMNQAISAKNYYLAALVSERRALYAFSHKNKAIAETNMQFAVVLWKRFGSASLAAKAEKWLAENGLAKENKFWKIGKSKSKTTDTGPLTSDFYGSSDTFVNASHLLDYASLIKAGQAITRETDKDGVADKILSIMLENAGAQQGMLFLKKGDEYAPVRMVTLQGTELSLKNINKESANPYPVSVIQYCARTQQSVYLDTGVSLLTFASDAFFTGLEKMWLTAIPMSHMGKCLGIIYLENKVASFGIVNKQLQVLEQLASQAAIAIENASKFALMVEKARLDAELSAAQAVQKSLLPEITVFPNIEISYLYKAATQTGGDWFGYYYDENSHTLDFFIGDVTGHGFPSALLTGVICGTIYSCEYTMATSYERESLSSQERIRKLAEAANALVLQTGKHSDLYMTMLFISIELESGKCTLLNSGHNLPLYMSSENNQLKSIPTIGNRLGFKSTLEFSIKEFQMQPGDLLFMYTDGLIENTGPTENSVLDLRALKKVLTKMMPIFEPKKVIDGVILAAENVWQDTPAADDVCMLTFCYQGPLSRTEFQDKKMRLSQ